MEKRKLLLVKYFKNFPGNWGIQISLINWSLSVDFHHQQQQFRYDYISLEHDSFW